MSPKNEGNGCAGILVGTMLFSAVVILMAVGMVLTIWLNATLEVAFTILCIGSAFPILIFILYMIARKIFGGKNKGD